MKKTLLFISLLIILSVSVFGKEMLVSNKLGQSGNSYEFIENKGQFRYSATEPAEDVLYVANTEYGRLLLRKKGVSFVFIQKESEKTDSKKADKILRESVLPKPARYSSTTTEMLFAGANPDVKITALEPLDSYNNYYIGQNHFTFVKVFKKIVYENVYPSIDFVVYTGKDNNLEYDFVVRPGGNPSQIVLKFNNYNEMTVNEEQKLVVRNSMGSIEQFQPFTYQTSKTLSNAIQSNFMLDKDNCVRFKVGEYNPQEKLVIDPIVRIYGYGYGGIYEDEPNDIAVDSLGNTYTCGYTYSPDLYVDGRQFLLMGGGDGFIIKLDTKGNRIWSTYYGGTGGDWANGIVVDKTGNIIVTGCSQHGSQELYANVNQLTIKGPDDAFIVKFEPDGTLIWATFFGWDGVDAGEKVMVDDNNFIFIMGHKGDSTDAISGYDDFVLKLTPEGNTVWATPYVGSGIELNGDIAVDKKGNVYICGETTSEDLLKVKGEKYHGDWDGFIAKFDSLGNLQWTRYVGAKDYDACKSIVVDDSGFVYIVGVVSNASFTTTKTHTKFHGTNGYNDILIAKYNNDGDMIWGEFYGSPNSDIGFHIALDKFNNVYVTGFAAKGYPDTLGMTGNVYNTKIAGFANAVIIMLNSDGEYVWNTFLQGKGVWGKSICVDNQQNIYVTGWTQLDDMEITAGKFPNPQDSYYENIYVYKLANPVIITSIPKVLCRGSDFRIKFIVNSDIDSNNVFKAELSDSLGSFLKPLTIGHKQGNISGEISAFIPDSVSLGSKYKVRIRYSDSIFTPDDWKNIIITDKKSIKINGSFTACQNAIEEYSVQKDSNIEFNWKITGGRILTKPDSNFVKVIWDSSGKQEISQFAQLKNSGCMSIDSLIVDVLPIVEITADSVTAFCVKDSPIELTIAKPTGGIYSGKGILSNTFYPDSAGIGTFIVNYNYLCENGCHSIREMKFIVNQNPPTPKISFYGDKIVSSSDTENEWYCNDTLIPGAKGNRLIMPKTGRYSVRVRDTNNCASDMSNYIDFVNGVEDEMTMDKQFSVSPNPANENIIVTTNKLSTDKVPASNLKIRIFSFLGFELYHLEVKSGGKISIPVKELPQGVYFIKAEEINVGYSMETLKSTVKSFIIKR